MKNIQYLILTVPTCASTMGKPKELTISPIVRKIAVSMHGEEPPPEPSLCLRAIMVGMGHST